MHYFLSFTQLLYTTNDILRIKLKKYYKFSEKNITMSKRKKSSQIFWKIVIDFTVGRKEIKLKLFFFNVKLLKNVHIEIKMLGI